MKWYPTITNNLKHVPWSWEPEYPAYSAASKMLEEVRIAIGDANWYAWMTNIRPYMPTGSEPRWTWEEVEAIAARKLYLVTAEAMQSECQCNGVTTCPACVTKSLVHTDSVLPF